MRKGRRERIEKGSRERIEKETKRQFEEKEGLRDPPPPPLEFLDPTLRCSHCFFKSSGWSSIVQLPQGTEFPTRFCSKALQHLTLKY